MDRPALGKLLADVEAGRVDVIVVYKVDRLTRSLADFARIVEALDQAGASFVSVTQQFNTTNSMGRLTLNVLLSFAQFEREVTGERIRDKIAASKRKGMWMGGNVPLGYDIVDRKLVVNKVEADIVRELFHAYVDTHNVRHVTDRARERGHVTKRRKSKSGKIVGGRPITRGHVYQILSNPIYVGRIRHKELTYSGEHDAIVSEDLWEKTQATLASNRVVRRGSINAKEPSLLSGLLFDDAGNRFAPSHAVKAGRRYRYYVQQTENGRPLRIPAREIENVVTSILCAKLVDQRWLAGLVDEESRSADGLQERFDSAAELAKHLSSDVTQSRREVICKAVDRITIREDGMTIDFELYAIGEFNGSDATSPIEVPAKFVRRGIERRFVLEGVEHARHPDPALVRLVVQAHDWWDRLLSGTSATAAEIAASEGVERTYVSRILRLAFLAPDIVEAILDGTAPVSLTAERLSKHVDLPLTWSDQRRLLGDGASQT